MPFMQIESIEIHNYRVFQNAVLKNLPKLTALIGANGTGKSTLFDVFSFLKDALTHNVSKAVSKRGGFRELVSRGASGPITLAFKFRETGGRLATYELAITSDGGKTVVEREVLKFRRGQRGKPWHFVDFSRGKAPLLPTKRPTANRVLRKSVRNTPSTNRTSSPSRALDNLRNSGWSRSSAT